MVRKAAVKRQRNPEVALPSRISGKGKLTVIAPAQPMTEAAAFMQMIERAAKDPTIDVAKLKELLAIRDREREREAVTAFAMSMSDAQGQMEPVRRDCSNPNTKSRYASYQALDAAVRPVYSRHGFALTFNTEPQSSQDISRVTCLVMHKGGHTVRYQKDMPIVTTGPKGTDMMTRTHASVSADTYAMRDLLRMIWNIATFDDDGNAAGSTPIDAQQLIELEKLIEETGADLDKFCAYMGVSELAALPARKFENAKTALRNVAKKAGR
jgi:hypothetical protein